MNLSKLNQRRLNNFKITEEDIIHFGFLLLFIVTLFADFIANEKPY